MRFFVSLGLDITKLGLIKEKTWNKIRNMNRFFKKQRNKAKKTR